MNEGTELDIEIKLLYKKIMDAGEQMKIDGDRLKAMISTRMEMLDSELKMINKRTEALKQNP